MKRGHYLRSTVRLFLAACVFFVSTADASEFIPLGDLSGGTFSSRALAIDSRGLTVVGSSSVSDSGDSQAFQWNDLAGIQSIPLAADATATSSNGEVVVGHIISTGVTVPYRWTESGGLDVLGVPPGEISGTPTFAVDVSGDGFVVTGTTVFGGSLQAYRWTENEGFVGLGDLVGNLGHSAASAISANGDIIVGSSDSLLGQEAFRWTATTGMLGLGDLAGGSFSSEAVGISPDGAVIVGTSDSDGGREAFRWTEAKGIEGLGFLSNSLFESVAIAASESGGAIVGFSGILKDMQAFVWTESDGLRSLQSTLENQFGLEQSLAGWRLTIPHDISADGLSIVGRGLNPNGELEAWLVRLDHPINIPEPSTLALLAGGILTTYCRMR